MFLVPYLSAIVWSEICSVITVGQCKTLCPPAGISSTLKTDPSNLCYNAQVDLKELFVILKLGNPASSIAS